MRRKHAEPTGELSTVSVCNTCMCNTLKLPKAVWLTDAKTPHHRVCPEAAHDRGALLCPLSVKALLKGEKKLGPKF